MAGLQAEQERVLNYVSLSVMTIMTYNWALSFGDEVVHIWAAAWSAPKVLYIISRYYPMVYLTILYVVRNLVVTSNEMYVCSGYTWYHGFGGVICILPVVTAIFTLRVCAMYRESWSVILLVWFLWFVEAAGELITTVRVTVREHTEGDVIYGPGCFTITKADPSLYRSELLAWAPALIGSTTLFILTLWKCGYLFPLGILRRKEHKKEGSHNRMMVTMMTDGTIYFFFVFVATLLTMISDLIPGLSFFNDWWNPWFILFYSLSGSELVLNLRRKAAIDVPTESCLGSSGSVQFAPPIGDFWTPSFHSLNLDDPLRPATDEA